MLLERQASSVNIRLTDLYPVAILCVLRVREDWRLNVEEFIQKMPTCSSQWKTGDTEKLYLKNGYHLFTGCNWPAFGWSWQVSLVFFPSSTVSSHCDQQSAKIPSWKEGNVKSSSFQTSSNFVFVREWKIKFLILGELSLTVFRVQRKSFLNLTIWASWS